MFKVADLNNDQQQQLANERAELNNSMTGVEDIGEGRAPAKIDAGGDYDVNERPEKKEPVIGSKFNDKRAEIAKKFRAERDARNGEDSLEIVPKEREKVFFGEGVETRQDRIDRQREARGEPVGDQKPAMRRLKVNGREIEVSEDDLVKHASRSLAGDDHLEASKRIRDEANQILGELNQIKRTAISVDHGETVENVEDRPTETAAILDGVDLDKIAERVQLGTAKEAKEALAELISVTARMATGNLDERVTEIVTTNTENSRKLREAREAISELGTTYPELTSKPMQAALAVQTIDVMRDAMRGAGLTDEFVEDLKRTQGWDDLRATKYCYDEMERLGHRLPSRKEILTKASGAIIEMAGLAPRRSPSALTLGDRQDRKQQITSQPRRALQPSNLEQRERSRDEVRRDAVAQMRAARGRRR